MNELWGQVKALLSDKGIRLPLFIIIILAFFVWGFIKKNKILGGLTATRRRYRRARTRIRTRYVRSRARYRSRRRRR